MVGQISVVINTSNEEKNIEQTIKNVHWADEIIVCDMHSSDKTAEIAKKLGAKVIFHKKENYVEPARNFAISKTSCKWVLILDADEEIPGSLSKRLEEIAKKMHRIDFVEIPRKNIIFGKWIKNCGWWPDYQIRFFKKGAVLWDNVIHSKPKTKGVGLTLSALEKWSIRHHSYKTVSQFLDRMDRYTDIEAEQLQQQGYVFSWKDLFDKPLNEFLSRFFANQGYRDGLHGLALSLLQAFSFLVVYLKLWEMDHFPELDIDLQQLSNQKDKSAEAIDYWIKKTKSRNIFELFFRKIWQ